MDAQLLGTLNHALASWRTHPPSHISFNRLAVTTHCSAPSSPLVGKWSEWRGVNFAGRGGTGYTVGSIYRGHRLRGKGLLPGGQKPGWLWEQISGLKDVLNIDVVDQPIGDWLDQ
jgi:hypothetical protein